MKKAGIIIGIVLVVLLAAAFILPIIFKDDIKAAIDRQLAKSINADVLYEADNFSLTLFKNFPSITAEIRNLGVINREPFAGDILFAVEKVQVQVNLKDVLFGDQLRVKGITLVRPIININVLADGRANYDIALPSADTVTTSGGSGEFSFGIDNWQIVEGDITYNDKAIPMLAELKNISHTGSGDFTQQEFDMNTKTTVDTLNVNYGGMTYLSEKRAVIDMTITISEEYSNYTFKENALKLNDFAMNFDGWFKMNEKDYAMDISFKSPENTFKSLLSLVPGMYSESFKDIETSGDLAFTGFVKGTYSETQLPAFNVDLKVINAMFKYPDLPTAINNINVDVVVDNKDGVIDNTIINIKQFNMNFGSNPVEAQALISKIYPTTVDARVKAKLNLAELSKMFPVQGLDLRGNYALDLTAKGVYDSLKKTIPAIEASMSLANGYVKSSEFPLPLQDLKFNSSIKNTSGKMADTFIAVNDLSLNMDGEKFTADMRIQNLDDYTWDIKAKGGVDLEKITKIFPIEGMTLAGQVKADLETKGRMSDLDAKRYDKLPTSGSATLANFKYTTNDMPPVTLSRAEMSFDPKSINLKQLTGTVGKSDFDAKGSVSNYIGYVFGKNELLKGTVTFNSTMLDLNEFMETETPTVQDTTGYSIIPVPQNVDFVLTANVKTIKMMDYTMTNAKGDVVVRDGVANLSGLSFSMLGGSFLVTGSYNTKDLRKPKYDLALKIQDLSIAQAAASFSIVKTFAPVAGLINGKFSTDFKLGGELLQNFSPNLATVNGDGVVKIAQASLKDSKLISGITSVTKLDDTNEVTLKDVLMSTSIKDGRLSVKPFDVQFGSYKTTVAGSTGLNGTIEYNLKMDVPAGKLGSQLNSFINKYTGSKTDPNAPIPVTIGLGGTVTKPVPKLLMSEQKEQVQEAAKEAIKQEAAKKAESLVKDLLNKKEARPDSTKVKPDSTKTKSANEKAKEDAVNKIQELLKKKKKG